MYAFSKFWRFVHKMYTDLWNILRCELLGHKMQNDIEFLKIKIKISKFDKNLLTNDFICDMIYMSLNITERER